MSESDTYNVTRFACHCGRFLADAAIRSEDYRDPNAYYGVGTRVEWDCSYCGTVQGEPWEPRIVVVATHVIQPALDDLEVLRSVWHEHIAPRLVVTETGCWEWSGSRVRAGYGRFPIGRVRVKTHRIAAAVHLGLDISDRRAFVCHRCDNPPCCNPDHLFLGNNSLNVLDAIEKGRRPRILPNSIPRSHCAKGHDKQGWHRCRECEKARHQKRGKRGGPNASA